MQLWIIEISDTLLFFTEKNGEMKLYLFRMTFDVRTVLPDFTLQI